MNENNLPVKQEPKFDALVTELSNANTIFNFATERTQKATAKLENIEKAIAEIGMSPEIDERLKNFILNADKAKKEYANGEYKVDPETKKNTTELIRPGRLHLTRLLDAIKSRMMEPEKTFTELSKRAQTHRDNYATKLYEEQKKKDEEIRKEAEKKQELILIKQQICTEITGYLFSYILSMQTKWRAAFESYTIENIESSEARMKEKVFALPTTFFTDFKFSFTPKLNDISEVAKIRNEVLTKDYFKTLNNEYSTKMDIFRLTLISEIPTRKQALLDIELAKQAGDAQKAKDIETELAQVKETSAKEIEQNIQASQETATANIMSQTIASQVKETTEMLANISSEIPSSSVNKVVKKQIEVLNKSAFIELAAYWFQKEGIGLSDEELTKKFGFAIKYAENIANKENILIESTNFKYVDSVTASKK